MIVGEGSSGSSCGERQLAALPDDEAGAGDDAGADGVGVDFAAPAELLAELLLPDELSPLVEELLLLDELSPLEELSPPDELLGVLPEDELEPPRLSVL